MARRTSGAASAARARGVEIRAAQSPVGRHRRPVRRALADRSHSAACDGQRALRENPLSASALRFLLHFLCDTIGRAVILTTTKRMRMADGRMGMKKNTHV